ncbi:2-amino-4-hydroxy-6-hydroxymethyldihydropteridine diphosphokinase [Wenzhouxiangella marina]|uniref:2-amino-4-hydroxy-6-hydroxymethyldihydropteridine pyrophosphokinase n=1 Tax=Wenzhouxiangella marina TaxID=1579979 RepID=A0A0K0XUJ7_9GAMM|nr:2-amino-4-hydroxy-6-hydroxymethyldihydropteridine diphosphokinase [Wenzhouxiangella marina]AKS41297.1 2-amino-4-hydroxy-6-hydroxymethyldihydropteridine pyrophosphokinase [Wenzhouxiangella marina]MBB6086953.1 2-amino-4-hydroxy-6-hydroxymethyldihydropteridine diphosphokinase [Wenzhouxiangella marina]
MSRAWVGLGSNQGDSADLLEQALEAIAALPRTRLLAVSPAYRTPAWGVTDQPDFLNAVAELETDMSPECLLGGLLGIESALGRRREGPRWGPRLIDLDLLLVDGLARSTMELSLPHPRLHERAFVLIPLNDLAPELEIPGRGKVGALLAELPASEREAIRSAPALRYQTVH